MAPTDELTRADRDRLAAIGDLVPLPVEPAPARPEDRVSHRIGRVEELLDHDERLCVMRARRGDWEARSFSERRPAGDNRVGFGSSPFEALGELEDELYSRPSPAEHRLRARRAA